MCHCASCCGAAADRFTTWCIYGVHVGCDCVAMQAALNAVAAAAAVVRVTAFGSCDNPLDEHVDGRLGAG